MTKKQAIAQIFQSLPRVLLGNAIYALTMKLFFFHTDLVVGGTNGIALIMNHFFGLSITAFVFIFNMIMLVVALLLLGKSFVVTTIVSSFAYPLILALFNNIFGDLILTDNLLLNTLFSGLGIGIGLGIVIRAGASTGGMDIPPLALNKYFRVPVSVGMYAFDFIIIIVQILFQSVEMLLYGIILTLVYTIVLNKLLTSGAQRTELKIISKHNLEIRDAIIEKIDRGVTMIEAEGGYLKEKTQMVFTVISNRELPRLERIIRSIDPEAFIVISHVGEVRGYGFSLIKDQEHASRISSR